MQLQWYQCIMDTLGPTIIECPEYRFSLYDKAPFGIITACVDYAGVIITKY